MKRFLIVLTLLAVTLSACVSVPVDPAAGTEAPANEAPQEAPAGTETQAPTEEMPSMTEAPNPDDPVTSEDTPGAPEDTEPSPLDPLPNEENLIRGNVFLEEVDMLVLESFPVQIVLHLQGHLPSPCHNLRAEVSEPDDQNRIQVEVYSLVDPAVMCAQVLEEFDTRISLGSYPSGDYTVWVNGEQVGEFTS
jgi:inhibitor of cysteine peptidase